MHFIDRDDFFRFRVSIASQFPFITSKEDDNFLAAVANTSHSREVIRNAGDAIYRAQIACDWIPDADVEDAYRVPATESRMRPDAKKVSDGRVNPRGVAVFYGASDIKTAVSEMRPWNTAHLTVSTFCFNRDVRLVDCSVESMMAVCQWLNHKLELNPAISPQPCESEITNNMVWHDIDTCFSRPVSRSDPSRQYRSTQCLAGLFLREGFDGIVYRSKTICGTGRNYVIFDQTLVDLTNSIVVEVEIQEPRLKVLCDNSDPRGPHGVYQDI